MEQRRRALEWGAQAGVWLGLLHGCWQLWRKRPDTTGWRPLRMRENDQIVSRWLQQRGVRRIQLGATSIQEGGFYRRGEECRHVAQVNSRSLYLLSPRQKWCGRINHLHLRGLQWCTESQRTAEFHLRRRRGNSWRWGRGLWKFTSHWASVPKGSMEKSGKQRKEGLGRAGKKGYKSVSRQSVQFSSSVMSDSLRPHGLQHIRPPCLSPTPGVYSNSCSLRWWCHPTISSSVLLLSSRLQSFPASGFFQMS